MKTKQLKIIYLISTILLTILMGGLSAGNYIFNHEMVKGMFTEMGYPTFLIYPMAIAKISGLVALWNRRFLGLREWAYAGFCFNLVLALITHTALMDGAYAAPIAGLILLFTSYVTVKKLEA